MKKTIAAISIAFLILLLSSYADTTTSTLNIVIPVCGDGVCNGNETVVSCPRDCTRTIIQIIGGGSHRSESTTSQLGEIEKLEQPITPEKGVSPVSNILSLPRLERPVYEAAQLVATNPYLKIAAIAFMLITAFLIGTWVNAKISFVKGKEGELLIKNKFWFFRNALGQIFVVSEINKLPANAKFIFGDEELKFQKFTGNAKDFFKKALESGPLMTMIGNKAVFAIKNNKHDFINMFYDDEIKVEGEGVSDNNSSVYFVKKKHSFEPKIQENLWKMLEPRNENDTKIYFKKLLLAAKKVNLKTALEFRDYIKNITEILQ